MIENQIPPDDELVAAVQDAFERMELPAAPAAHAVPRSAWPDVDRSRSTGSLSPRLQRRQWRLLGGVGLSTALTAAALWLAWHSAHSLSAMERMTRELRDVRSYRYLTSETVKSVADDGNQTSEWISTGATHWSAAGGFRNELKIVETKTPAVNQHSATRVLEDFVEVFPAGNEGLFIDLHRKTFRRLPFDPIGSATYPLDLLRMVREHSGKVLRDLGSKEIAGTRARGYEMALEKPHDVAPRHPVEVWVDPATDLPLELNYRVHDKHRSTEWLARDFRWNMPLDTKLFEPTPLKGYADITSPTDERAFVDIANALRLYSQLSGGHYPRVEQFDAGAIRDEMRRMVGSSANQADDQRLQQIQAATAGLDWIARILRNTYHSGYLGTKVGHHDKDKVLLWWRVFQPDRIRVFYGDLRSEILTEAEAARMGLTDLPEESK
jgi:hypothetical protein